MTTRPLTALELIETLDRDRKIWTERAERAEQQTRLQAAEINRLVTQVRDLLEERRLLRAIAECLKAEVGTRIP